MSEGIRGYKVFNQDWTCRGFQYQVGGTYEEDLKPSCCDRGFHFCLKVSDCFNYYDFDSDNKVAEVIAMGDVDYSENNTKCCTNKIQIVREIPWDELLGMVNEGKNCTGFRNTGNSNTGNWNTGDGNTGFRNTGNRNTRNRNTGNSNTGFNNTGNCNTGNWNTGNSNTGNWNTGDGNTGFRNTGSWNTGSWNTGNRNTGNRNTGNRNTGDWNTGDWNTGDWNTGCFCTEAQRIMLFNKNSDWTYNDWFVSNARSLLNQIPKKVVEWIEENEMTDEEKKENPEYKITGGYLKVLDELECAQLWWDGLSESDKQIIMDIPNFDPVIFEQCVGIKIRN